MISHHGGQIVFRIQSIGFLSPFHHIPARFLPNPAQHLLSFFQDFNGESNGIMSVLAERYLISKLNKFGVTLLLFLFVCFGFYFLNFILFWMVSSSGSFTGNFILKFGQIVLHLNIFCLPEVCYSSQLSERYPLMQR